MQGNVNIIDANNTLTTQNLTYNVKTKIGKYSNGGTLQNEETNVSSNIGTYNGYTFQSYFKDNVVISNPKYTIESKELTYNTKSKLIKLLDESTIMTEEATIKSKTGTYDTKSKQAYFTSPTTIETNDEIIYANNIAYNEEKGTALLKGKVHIIDLNNNTRLWSDIADFDKKKNTAHARGNVVLEQEQGKNVLFAKDLKFRRNEGYGIATQHVIVIDTAQHSKLQCEQLEFNQYSSFVVATGQPRIRSLLDKDSLFVRADTIVSVDEKLMWVFQTNDQRTKKVHPYLTLLHADSTYKKLSSDSSQPKIIIAHSNVKMYSDSLQAVCDSLIYLQSKAAYSLFKQPVLWNKNQQANADTIHIYLKDDMLYKMHLIQNAFLLSETGYDTFFDQVSGNYIYAYFQEGKIQQVDVNQNAQSIYYPKDDQNAYIGMDRAESGNIRVYFEDESIIRIVKGNDVKGSTTPIDKLIPDAKFLPSFKRFDSLRPKNKSDILK
jgi:hypothetical protein